MSLIYNGTEIPQERGNLIYNDTLLTQVDVKENAEATPVTVWQCSDEINFGYVGTDSLRTPNVYISYGWDESGDTVSYDFIEPGTSASSYPMYITFDFNDNGLITGYPKVANGIWSQADGSPIPGNISETVTYYFYLTNPTNKNLRFEISSGNKAEYKCTINSDYFSPSRYFIARGSINASGTWTKSIVVPAKSASNETETVSTTITANDQGGTVSIEGTTLLGSWSANQSGAEDCESDIYYLTSDVDYYAYFPRNCTWSIYDNDTSELLASGTGVQITADIGI